jgi:hypothetical protein
MGYFDNGTGRMAALFAGKILQTVMPPPAGWSRNPEYHRPKSNLMWKQAGTGKQILTMNSSKGYYKGNLPLSAEKFLL